MSDIRIEDTEELTRFSEDLGRFAETCVAVVRALRLRCARMDERQRELRLELMRRQRYLRELARSARDPRERQQALADLDELREEMRRLARAEQAWETARLSLQTAMGQLGQVLDHRTPEARAFLARKHAELVAYYRMLGAVPTAPGTTAFTTPRVSDNAETPPETAPSRGALPDPTRVGLAELPRLPEGFEWIPVDLANPADLPDRTEFRKLPYETMRSGFETFWAVVLPEIMRDRNLARQALERSDLENGRFGADSPSNLYDVFFGTDPIAVTWLPRGALDISSGKHRLRVARDLGWRFVPGKWLSSARPEM